MKKKIINLLLRLQYILSQESIETKDMLFTYKKYLRGEASRTEMNKANKQFRELIKSLSVGVFVILPFAPVTIPIAVKIGKKFGIEILPNAFRDLDG